MRIVDCLSKRDFSHVEDVNPSEYRGFTQERKYLLSMIYEESDPVKIGDANKRPERSRPSEENIISCSGDDEEFSSTEDTPVDRVKTRRKRKRSKHSIREELHQERLLFTMEL